MTKNKKIRLEKLNRKDFWTKITPVPWDHGTLAGCHMKGRSKWRILVRVPPLWSHG